MSRATRTTDDGTTTLYMDEYGQTMHTSDGAYEEALIKHVQPSGLLNRTSNSAVLDIGFGLGYNVLALLHEWGDRPENLHITSLERDRTFTDIISSLSFKDDRDILYNGMRELYSKGTIHGANYDGELIFGDARDSICSLKDGMFHAVFQDPFSPGANPELWSLDFMKELYRVSAPGAVVTTYSSAIHVRRAFFDAGFSLAQGPPMGRKREGTIAVKGELAESMVPLDTGFLKEIKSVPYRDRNLKGGRDDIIKERLLEMKELKKA